MVIGINRLSSLVFTDLDGTLLDHHSYSYAPAESTIRLLENQSIPLIPVTSKTRAELMPLREALQNSHPFIIENGAGVYIPEHYFPVCPSGCELIDGYWVKAFSRPRSVWLNLLQKLADRFDGDLLVMSRAETAEVAELTGLSLEQARLAQQREFSEPLQWRGSKQRYPQFLAELKSYGITPLRGGRFLHLVDNCNKGQALRWLAGCYQSYQPKQPITTLAAGDSDNDLAMLLAADLALLVRSPVHAPPAMEQREDYLLSEACGPQGWATGIRQLLSLPPIDD